MENTGQTGGTAGADVSALEAWEIEDGDPSIVVAIVDSGTDWNHPDLANAMWDNTDETINGSDDDGNGFVDDVRGWDFDSGDNDPTGLFFHGTGVASCVGASSGNGIGIAALAGGACDGAGCSLMNLNVGSFAPNSSVLDDAILYAAENGAQVITMSLTVPQSAAIDAAIDFAHDTAGSFIDCAAGNNGFSVTYPANHPSIMAIASSNDNDDQSSFSNPGPEVEVAAPGEDILMADLGNGYLFSSGTSFAAPHVAALAGLILSVDPNLTNAQVRQIIIDSADDIEAAGFDNQTGWGRINALSALQMVDGNSVPATLATYGTGLAGTNGIPQAVVPGNVEPLIGTTGYELRVTNALANTGAFLVFGFGADSIPYKGGELLVDLTLPWVLIPATTNGIGAANFIFDIPDDEALLGIGIYSQWVISDPGAIFGTALSNGVEAIMGNVSCTRLDSIVIRPPAFATCGGRRFF